MRSGLAKRLGIPLIVGSLALGSYGCATTSQQTKKDESYDEEKKKDAEEFTEGDFLEVAGAVADDPLAGLALGILGRNMNERDQAERSKSEVRQEVNVYDASQRQIGNQTSDPYYPYKGKIGNWIPPPPSFSCLSKINDDNNDGYFGRDEINLTSYFPCKKLGDTVRVSCGSIWSNINGQNVISKITNNRTGNSFIEEHNTNENNVSFWHNIYFYKVPGESGVETYTVDFYVNGQKIPSRTIEFFVDYGE